LHRHDYKRHSREKEKKIGREKKKTAVRATESRFVGSNYDGGLICSWRNLRTRKEESFVIPIRM